MDEVLPTVPLIEAAYEPYHPKKDVEKTVPYDLLLQAEKQARQFTIILGTIAAISLLVGGIGIMNIMLATVTERTREIGIRRALGAKRRDITQQFLIETVVLAGVGGLLGVLLGFTIPQVIIYFIPDQKAVVTGASVMLAFSISVAVGILFGIYPAARAALHGPHRGATARMTGEGTRSCSACFVNCRISPRRNSRHGRSAQISIWSVVNPQMEFPPSDSERAVPRSVRSHLALRRRVSKARLVFPLIWMTAASGFPLSRFLF